MPLNRYSFFKELEDKMLVPKQLELNIQPQDDDEPVYRAAAVDNNNPARVVVTRFQLWVPKLTPKDSMYDKYVLSFLKQKRWK